MKTKKNNGSWKHIFWISFVCSENSEYNTTTYLPWVLIGNYLECLHVFLFTHRQNSFVLQTAKYKKSMSCLQCTVSASHEIKYFNYYLSTDTYFPMHMHIVGDSMKRRTMHVKRCEVTTFGWFTDCIFTLRLLYAYRRALLLCLVH